MSRYSLADLNMSIGYAIQAAIAWCEGASDFSGSQGGGDDDFVVDRGMASISMSVVRSQLNVRDYTLCMISSSDYRG